MCQLLFVSPKSVFFHRTSNLFCFREENFEVVCNCTPLNVLEKQTHMNEYT